MLLALVDELLGRGMTRTASRIHFHPHLRLEAINGTIWQIKGCASSLWLSAFGHQNHSVVRGQKEPVREGWYSESFGELVPNVVLILNRESNLPFCYGYVISMNEPAKADINLTSKRFNEIAVIYAQHHCKLQLGVNGVLYSQ
jgi:hypothetical protein